MKHLKITLFLCFVLLFKWNHAQVFNVSYTFTQEELLESHDHVLIRNTTRDQVAVFFESNDSITQIQLFNNDNNLMRTINTPEALKQPKISFSRLPAGNYTALK